LGFKSNSFQVKRILVPTRENPIINRLNKTKVEKFPDLKQEKDDHLRELRKKDRAAQLERVCNSSIIRAMTANNSYTEKGRAAHRQGARPAQVAERARL